MRYLILCLASLWSINALAASYYVSDVKSADAGVVESLKSLITSAVSNAGSKLADTPQAADYVLNTDVLRLGQAYILTVTRLKNGTTINSSRQKASTAEELDDAADRAVRATILGTTTKQDLRVGEVTPREEDRLSRRIKSKSSNYFGFGPATFNNMGTKPLAYDLAIGHNWEVTPQAAIRVLFDGVMSNDWKTYFVSGGLGLNYMLTDMDNSPYVGGTLGFGFSGSRTTAATSIGGFDGMLGLGWQFFRTSSTQFDVFAGYTAIFGNNTIGAPGVYGVRIGVLW
jgi:hypothetical protein